MGMCGSANCSGVNAPRAALFRHNRELAVFVRTFEPIPMNATTQSAALGTEKPFPGSPVVGLEHVVPVDVHGTRQRIRRRHHIPGSLSELEVFGVRQRLWWLIETVDLGGGAC
jgi:hypothetical protein